MVASVPAVDPIPDEEDLVRRAGRGDRAAFGELYKRYARMVHAILLARVPFSDAEDLVQEVFMSALTRMPLLRTPTAFRAWVASIARNRAIDFHRGARKDSNLEADTLPGRSVSHPEAFEILDIIRRLPEAYRETLLLRLVEGMTGPEIALRTGLTPGSVRVNLFRGMEMLRQQLGKGLTK